MRIVRVQQIAEVLVCGYVDYFKYTFCFISFQKLNDPVNLHDIFKDGVKIDIQIN